MLLSFQECNHKKWGRGNKILKSMKGIIKKFMWEFPSSMVLMFHHVTNIPQIIKSNCLVSTANFFSTINKISDFISCEELFFSKINEYKNKVALTFDDGLADVYSIAYQYLKHRNIPFTIFVTVNHIGTDGYITKEQLIEMSKDPLVTIGAHGLTHNVLVGLLTEQKWKEIYESKIKLEKLTIKKIKLFAYPHGQHDDECRKMVFKAGYIGAYGVRTFPINFYSKGWTFHLPRFNVTDEDIEKIDNLISLFLS